MTYARIGILVINLVLYTINSAAWTFAVKLQLAHSMLDGPPLPEAAIGPLCAHSKGIEQIHD